MRTVLFVFMLFCAVLPIVGCGSVAHLMDRPNLYSEENAKYLFKDTPVAFEKNPVGILYITDREEYQDIAMPSRIGYSSIRSDSISLGEVEVDMGWDMSWDELKEISYDKFRNFGLPLTITNINKMIESPPYPPQLTEKLYNKENGEGAYSRDALKTVEVMDQAILDKLALVNKNEVYVFVHGFNATFKSSVENWAQLWHYMGRTGLPIVYSWPAAAGGLTGYFADSEAGDASVAHLRLLLERLSQIPEIEKVHLIGHSRGCDILANTLIAMAIANTSRGRDPGEGYKLGNIVLLAPDIDGNFMRQRVVGNNVHDMPELFTIYSAPKDKALAFSQLLRAGMDRVGIINDRTLTEEDFDRMKDMDNVNIIISKAKASGLNHSYYINSTSVSADLILLLRYNLMAGEDNGRPLTAISKGIWSLGEGYPYNGYSLKNAVEGN